MRGRYRTIDRRKVGKSIIFIDGIYVRVIRNQHVAGGELCRLPNRRRVN